LHPIADSLFTDEDRPRLIGGKHRESGRIVFPLPDTSSPGVGDFEAFPLRRDGRLWSYTVQRFRPKSPPYAGPEEFTPWAIGYVELPGETIVEARLTEVEFDRIEIGMALEFTSLPLNPADDDPAMIPAFRPVETTA